MLENVASKRRLWWRRRGQKKEKGYGQENPGKLSGREFQGTEEEKQQARGFGAESKQSRKENRRTGKRKPEKARERKVEESSDGWGRKGNKKSKKERAEQGGEIRLELQVAVFRRWAFFVAESSSSVWVWDVSPTISRDCSTLLATKVKGNPFCLISFTQAQICLKYIKRPCCILFIFAAFPSRTAHRLGFVAWFITWGLRLEAKSDVWLGNVVWFRMDCGVLF